MESKPFCGLHGQRSRHVFSKLFDKLSEDACHWKPGPVSSQLGCPRCIWECSTVREFIKFDFWPINVASAPFSRVGLWIPSASTVVNTLMVLDVSNVSFHKTTQNILTVSIDYVVQLVRPPSSTDPKQFSVFFFHTFQQPDLTDLSHASPSGVWTPACLTGPTGIGTGAGTKDVKAKPTGPGFGSGVTSGSTGSGKVPSPSYGR